MMQIILENISQNREQWLELRRSAVTSSKIATICGFNTFETVYERWAKDTGKIPDDQLNEDMEQGSHMQPFIMKMLQRRSKYGLVDADCLVQDPQIPWALASPDCWEIPGDLSWPCEPFGISELKNTNLALSSSWNDEAPAGPTLQLQWQLGCCRLKSGHVAGMIGGSARRLKNFWIEFDPHVYDAALEAGDKYRQNVERDIPPDAGPGDLRLVGALAGARIEQSVDLSDDPTALELMQRWQDYAPKYDAARKEFNAWKTKRDGLKARFVQLLGNNIFGRVQGFAISAKIQERRAFEVSETEFLDVRVSKYKPIR